MESSHPPCGSSAELQKYACPPLNPVVRQEASFLTERLREPGPIAEPPLPEHSAQAANPEPKGQKRYFSSSDALPLSSQDVSCGARVPDLFFIRIVAHWR